MGHVHVEVTLEAERATTLRMLVDTGATYSFVLTAVVEAIGAPPKDERVQRRDACGSCGSSHIVPPFNTSSP
jgi:predicted aspartyl protease